MKTSRDLVEMIISRCREEIAWAQANIDGMNLPGNPHGYVENDRTWLPCWLKAHKEMLELITKEGEKWKETK